MSHRLCTVIGGLAVALLSAGAALAADPVPPSGTTWVGTARLGEKLPHAGNHAGPVDFRIDFGPNAGLVLGPTEFHASLNDGVVDFTLSGTYAVDAKGQPVLTPDLDLLADDLHALLVHVCEDILLIDPGECATIGTLDVLTDVPHLVLEVKTAAGRHGDPATLRFTGKIPFALDNGTDTPPKFTVTLKTSPAAVPAF